MKMQSSSEHRIFQCSRRDEMDEFSVSTYADVPPATYKRPFEFPKGTGTFDAALEELSREMERLKVKIATSAKSRQEQRPTAKMDAKISVANKEHNVPSPKFKLDSITQPISQSSKPSHNPRDHLEMRNPPAPFTRHRNRSSLSATDHRHHCRSHKSDLVRRQIRDATCRIRRIDSARTFSIQRGRDRRHRWKLKACAAASHPSVCSALHKLQHYHLDINHLPFMPSNPSGPSFNVKANVQQVIGRLKTHHPALCETRTHCVAKPARNRSHRKHVTAKPREALHELEQEYARTYRTYEHVKLDIITAKSKTHLRYLMGKKAMIKDRLRNLLQRMENNSAKEFNAGEGLCGRFQDKNLNTQQNLLRDLRDVQTLFDKCSV